MVKMLYYAVNGYGQGLVFKSLPVRDENRKTWLGESVGCLTMIVMLMESEGLALPPIKWSDEPVKLELKMEVC